MEQTPVPVLQTPALWHWSLAVQTTGLLPVQKPKLQESVCVHAFASLHDVPLGALTVWHAPVPVLQLSVVQGLLSLQITGFVPMHAPFEQASDCVHALLSEQGVPLGELGLVQRPVPGWQTPALWH